MWHKHGPKLSRSFLRFCSPGVIRRDTPVAARSARACSSEASRYVFTMFSANVLHVDDNMACLTFCSWLTLKHQHTAVLEAKKSKFLATAWPITAVKQVPWLHVKLQLALRSASAAFNQNFAAGKPVTCLQAEQYIEAHRDLSASHNCYAYKLGQEQRATDDGEPSGTAGQPILSAIIAEDLNGVCVLVTR